MKQGLEIISCSRRTDIPAFYYPWLQECLKSKYVIVKNPYNNSTSMVDLSPERVHSICLWSKNFANVLRDPGFLREYNLYFQFTITGYSKLLEANVIDINTAVKQMEKLSAVYSPQQVNWRFDPVILSTGGEKSPTPECMEMARLKVFEGLCRDLSSFGIRRCTISFLSLYRHMEQRFKKIEFNYRLPDQELKKEIIKQMVEIADSFGIILYACASPIIEEIPGVRKGHCIDGSFLEELFGKRASRARDTGQRMECGCTKSRDIGGYGNQICKHGCLYCYAM